MDGLTAPISSATGFRTREKWMRRFAKLWWQSMPTFC
jgi:hypothetical protein